MRVRSLIVSDLCIILNSTIIISLGNDMNVDLGSWANLGSLGTLGNVDMTSLNKRLGLLVSAPTFRPSMSPTPVPSSAPSGVPTNAPSSVPTEAIYLSDEFAMSSILFLCGLGVLQPIFGVILLNLWVW